MRSSWRIDCILALVIWIQLVCAAPAEHVTSSAVSYTLSSTYRSSSTHSSSGASASPEASSTQSSHPLIPAASPDDTDRDDPSSSKHSTSSHSLVIPPTRTRTRTRTRTAHSTGTHAHTSGSHPHPFPPSTPISSPARSSGHGQPVVAIVFEVLAGAAGLFIVLALARCLYSYRRTPSRDRIGALLNRHRLEREMEEMERDRMARISRALEPYRWRPPPPPYQAAPEYDTVVNTDGSIDWGRLTRPIPSHPPP